MSALRVVFCGTPAFALPSLDMLVERGHQVLVVLTRPDRPRGRGLARSPTPVKERAAALGLPVWQPERMSDPALLARLRELAPDALVLVAFGALIPPPLLELPRLGCINAHPSLLPAYRGAAPIQRALLDGLQETGVSTMYMAEGYDTGDIILQRRVPISSDDDAGTLHDRLAQIAAQLLGETLERLAAGTAPRIPQDHRAATYAPKIEPHECRIDWSRPAARIVDQIRALSPSPGAYTHHRNRRLKLWRARVDPSAAEPSGPPGTVLEAGPDGIAVLTGEGSLRILSLQP
ncbi:MAG TPA: methionyl-tRNA formyltransferase, partial [Limnochordia bacterium]